ncbi:hypothetical protein YC2023_105508 [Brassica napus]
MQRKHYRGLSNPQCLHGIGIVPSPRWMELTGRDLKFTIPPDASDFGSRGSLTNGDSSDQSPGHGVGGSNVSKKRKEFLSPGSSEEECCLTGEQR